jgi:hypothetical protein
VGALATAAVGLGLGLTANSEKDSIDERKRAFGTPCDPNEPSCLDTQHIHVDLAHGFLVGSAALASAAVVMLLVWPRSSSAVSISPRGGGADVTFSMGF